MPKKGGKKMGKMSGARLAMLYGQVPCRLGLCGPEDKGKQKTIAEFLKGDDGLEGKIREIIKEFKGAYPYYELIAKSNEILDPLDRRVVEAYWLGNNLLGKVKIANFRKMMEQKFLPLGKMPAEKIKNLPKAAIACHNFHVLNIGSVTGRFKETRAGLDLCRVSWGKIIKAKNKELAVLRQPLKFGSRISLGKPAILTIRWNKDILSDVNKGDWISIHWNTAIEKLTPLQLKNIQKYNKTVLKIINQ